MAKEAFNPQEFDINAINGGYRFEDGDVVNAQTINAVVEAAALMQNIAGGIESALDDIIMLQNRYIGGV